MSTIKKLRKLGLILYEDNQNHMYALDFIKKNYPQFIYIKHDKDKEEDGSFKKTHYHVLLYFPNQKSLNKILTDLNIEINCTYLIHSMTGQLRYLIHYDDEEKYQYSKDLVHGTRYMISKFNLSIKDLVSESEQVSMIIEYIFCSENKPTLLELIHFVIDNDYYSSFRRNYSLFRDLLNVR